MDSRFLFGLGVSFVFGFMRWRFPAVPKFLATFGAVIGIGLIVWSVYPAFDWRRATVLIVVVSAATALLDTVLAPATKKASTPLPTMIIDQSVTSHAQAGGITSRNVGSHNVDQ